MVSPPVRKSYDGSRVDEPHPIGIQLRSRHDLSRDVPAAMPAVLDPSVSIGFVVVEASPGGLLVFPAAVIVAAAIFAFQYANARVLMDRVLLPHLAEVLRERTKV
jgi:hypothetical protein